MSSSVDAEERLASQCTELRRKMQELLRASPMGRDQVLQLIDAFDFGLVRAELASERKLACLMASFLLHLLLTVPNCEQVTAQTLVLLRGPFAAKGSFIYLSDPAATDRSAEKTFLGSQLALRDGVLFNYCVPSPAKKAPLVLGVCLGRVLQNLGSPRFLECLPDPRTTCVFLFTQQGSQSSILSIQFSADQSAKRSEVILLEARTRSPQGTAGPRPSRAGSSQTGKPLHLAPAKKVARNEASIENLLRLARAGADEADRPEPADSPPKLKSESALKDLKASIVSKLRRAKLKTLLLTNAPPQSRPSLVRVGDAAHKPLERSKGSAVSKADCLTTDQGSPESPIRASFFVAHKPTHSHATHTRDELVSRSSSSRASPRAFRINKALSNGSGNSLASKRSADLGEAKGGFTPIFMRRTPGRQLKTEVAPSLITPSGTQNADQSSRSFFFKKRAQQI